MKPERNIDPTHPDACPRCHLVLTIGDFPFCSRFGDPSEHEPPAKYFPFKSFEYQSDIGTRQISGLNDIRRLERESEQRFRNKEGRPEIFRAFSQDHSNLTKPLDLGYGTGSIHPKEGDTIKAEFEGHEVKVPVKKRRGGKRHFKGGATKAPSA